MKNAALIFVVLILFQFKSFAQAENYQKIRFDFGFGYAMPISDRYVNGFGFSPELKFNTTDNLAIGVKWELYILSGNDHYLFEGSQLQSGVKINSGAITAFSFLGEYFFAYNDFRPFAGTGIGLYAGASSSEKAEVSTTNTSVSLNFGAFVGMGLSPTLGVQYKWLKLSATYNLIFSSTDVTVKEEITNNGSTETINTSAKESNNFIVIKLSLGIGGAKK